MSAGAGSRVDWAGLMRLGLGELRLAPEAFWSMTPRELEAAAAPWRRRFARPMSREALERLRARFPDAAPGEKQE
ncbi:rcc01693 family protein [Oceanicella actignis]|uniref:Phage tail assembly chaperone protein, TAC n=1 Tax=Oceanicella actignis TaxID=1189325 RepID=A0A1M7U051_9RHOB|nr:rcc01693 family protein [Oceanicella actignis]TYO85045.1 putative phage protein (TIGR02216 family) [Oceanicella actignis]SET83545.1 phage conserved hypothetical protein [Oceanicella actignis]SHN76230.1 phage conserved hypothetical protein [Oceanicella actignis]